MDKITYLRKAKEKINEEYLEKLHGIDEIFKSDNVQIAIYVGKNIICSNLYHAIKNDGTVSFEINELKSLLRGKLIHPSDWFISRCPKCGCYLYYPCASTSKGYPEYNKHGFGGICANCFEERLIENTKAINFPTNSGYQLVNYKYYIKAGTMNRNELEQFMKELGNKKYCNDTLSSIENDLTILELCDTIDSGNTISSCSIDSDNKEKDISARNDIEKTMKSFFGNIWDNLYQDEQSS